MWIISHGSDTTIFNTTYESEGKHHNIGRKVTRRKVSSLTSRGTLDPLTVTPTLADFVFFWTRSKSYISHCFSIIITVKFIQVHLSPSNSSKKIHGLRNFHRSYSSITPTTNPCIAFDVPWINKSWKILKAMLNISYVGFSVARGIQYYFVCIGQWGCEQGWRWNLKPMWVFWYMVFWWWVGLIDWNYTWMLCRKTHGMGAGRKLKSHRRRRRWADKSYKKSHLGNKWKKPFAGSSHSKGIVLEKM